MALIQALKKNRESFLDRHPEAGDWSARMFSAAAYSHWKVCRELMARRCAGLVLDAGSGRAAWREIALKTASRYESIDLAPRAGDNPTWVGDISSMPQVPDERYDTIVCHHVLEHVRHPWRVVAELYRVLKPGGTIILSVPHLSRRHELPHDYFRFTQEGLVALLEDAGYVRIAMYPYGGILSFIHHQTSFLVPGVLLGIPILGSIAIVINASMSWLLSKLDTALDRRSLMPLGILAVAEKPTQIAPRAGVRIGSELR
jgi:SAM-dependent methyltransferase